MVLENMAVCDLRCVKDADLAGKIEEIKNVGLLILPDDANCDISKTFENIKRTNVASEIQAGKNERLLWCILRGCAEFRMKYWIFKNKNGTNSF